MQAHGYLTLISIYLQARHASSLFIRNSLLYFFTTPVSTSLQPHIDSSPNYAVVSKTAYFVYHKLFVSLQDSLQYAQSVTCEHLTTYI